MDLFPLYLVTALQSQDLKCGCGNVLVWCLCMIIEGEILATMFQNSRDFLYPHQRLSFRGGAAEREMLMKRSSTFPVGYVPSIPFIYFIINSCTAVQCTSENHN